MLEINRRVLQKIKYINRNIIINSNLKLCKSNKNIKYLLHNTFSIR